MSVRLIIAAGKDPETFADFAGCAARLSGMALHPNTQEPRDVRVHWGQLSMAWSHDGAGTWPVAIVRAEDAGGVQTLGYVASDDLDLDAQAVAENMLAALVAHNRPERIFFGKVAA